MTSEQCREELLTRLRAKQRMNGLGGQLGADGELLKIGRKLYEILVPQSIGKSGQAQQIASNLLSPLTDPNSRGGRGEANSGRKPAWQKMRDEGNPRWEEAKRKYAERKKSDPTKDILKDLDDLRLLPLFDVYTEQQANRIQWKPLRKNQGVRPWDRDMFQQAIERLMSWESWNKRVGEEYASLLEQRERFAEEQFSGQQNLVELVQALEEEMKAESQGLDSVESTAHTISKRALRGWDRVHEYWRKLPYDGPFEGYDEAVRKTQAKIGRRFGSHDLFAKLAETKYQALWREDSSFVTRYAVYNSILRKLDHAKQFATFTLPSAYAHPIWTRFENAEGKNIYSYEFLFHHFGTGHHGVQFQHLLRVADGIPEEVDDVIVPVAASAQLNRLLSSDDESRVGMLLQDKAAPNSSLGAVFPGVFGGAKIQYDRRVLARKDRWLKKHRTTVHQGKRSHGLKLGNPFPVKPLVITPTEAGDVYLNFSLRVQSQSEVRNQSRPPYATLFRMVGDRKRTYVQYDKIVEYLKEHPDHRVKGSDGLLSGLRVMSVDLGLRTSASVSIFRVAEKDELKPNAVGKPPHFYDIKDTDLVAIHERSHLIKLPGETESKSLRAVRELRTEPLRQLRTQLTLLKQIVQCDTEDERRRDRNWEKLIARGADGLRKVSPAWRAVFEMELAKLTTAFGHCTDKEWSNAVQSAVRLLWLKMASQVRDWRKETKRSTKPKINGYVKDVVGGNGIAQIDYLEQQYRLLKSWSFFGRVPGQIVRAVPGSRFAVSLREHIDHAKEDRLKKLADRIIMEALGYVFTIEKGHKGEWVAKYPPCQLILLEELSEYRFNNDRPPSENNRLMQWSHRGILQELINQAEVHDVLIGTMYSAFSSRFDAKTSAPGVRCRRVPIHVVDGNEGVPIWLSRFLEPYGLSLEQVRPDDVVPTGDGEFFVAPFGIGHDDFRQVHADLNAAQNLQRRLWQDFDISQIRLRCDRREENGQVLLIPRLSGQRANESYKDTIFVSENDVTFYARSRQDARKKVQPRAQRNAEPAVAEETLELLLEADEAQEKSTVILRDLAGVINHGLWTNEKVFWSLVDQRVQQYLLSRILARSNELAGT